MREFRVPAGTTLSIVIVSWNTWHLLQPCLKALQKACGAVSGRCETIVVDNASADSTVERLQREFPWVIAVANGTNRGFAAATNQGILASAGTYVLLLNPDTEVDRMALAQLIEHLDAHPDVGAAGPRVVGVRGDLQESCFPLPTLTREGWRLLHLDRLWPLARYRLQAWIERGPRRVEALQGCCLLVRRSVFGQIGVLDEQFFIYTEEVDLCRRMQDAGWRLCWLPGATIVHYGGESTRQVARQMFLQLYRSKVQYFRKHAGNAGAWAYKGMLVAAAVPRIAVPALLLALQPRRRRGLQAMIGNYSALLHALPTW
jgi:GT2 family glycosyltransferase